MIYQSKISETRKFTLKYQWFGMNFDISRVDYVLITNQLSITRTLISQSNSNTSEYSLDTIPNFVYSSTSVSSN